MQPSERVARNVTSALDASAANVERVQPACWNYELKNGKIFPGMACIEGPWLTLEAAPRADGDPGAWCPWDALRTSSELGGLAKIALAECGPVIRADLPLSSEPGADLTSAIRNTCRAIEAVAYALGPAETNDASAVDTTSAAELPFDAPDVSARSPRLAQLATEAGWPHVERKDGTVAVELGIAQPHFEATLRHEGDRELRVRARIARHSTLSDTSRRALGWFLLEANAGVRLARATATDSAGEIEIAFEARLPVESSADQLGHALSAVTVATATWGVEIRALSIRHLASRFLAARIDAGRKPTTRSARKSRR